MIGARQLDRWAAENVGELHVDRDDEGRKLVLRADRIIAIRPGWWRTHGWKDIFREDGIVQFDEAGGWRYRPLHELPDGRIAYVKTTL